MNNLTEEQKNNIIAWIAALRSGNYEQGQGALFNPSTSTYCCLGVACEINRILRSLDGETFYFPEGMGLTKAPDHRWFLRTFGFDSSELFYCEAIKSKMELFALNDNKILDFKGIADLLEKTFIHSENDNGTEK